MITPQVPRHLSSYQLWALRGAANGIILTLEGREGLSDGETALLADCRRIVGRIVYEDGKPL